MIEFLRKIIKPKYKPLNRIEINAENILANFDYLRHLQPAAEIFPVLKSNAYGHGLKEMCQILNKTDAAMIVVDSFPEAQIAYRYFKGQVLILGEMPLRAYNYCRLNRTEFVVYNEETLKYLAHFGKRARIHLFVNSGMNREGIKDLDSFMAKNKKYLAKVEVSGLCSHFASIDEDSPLNDIQIDNFYAALVSLRSAGFFPRWVHLGNSAAAFTLKLDFLTAYRPGIALYGYSPFAEDGESDDKTSGGREAAAASGLKPALRVISRIVSVQEIKSGESVSYNETFRADRPLNIAVIPFGYFEGLDRRLSNKADFLVESGRELIRARIAGRICMNLTCLNVGEKNVKIGDQVIIVSDRPEDPNSIINLAAITETIAYEFLVRLQANIRREIV